MSRKKRFVVWLTGVLTILVMVYACSPWLLAVLIKQQLSAHSITNVQLKVGYPDWHGIQLSSMSLQTMVGAQQFSVQVPDVEITYQAMELLAGTITSIHIPLITLQLEPTTPLVPVAQSGAELPVASLLSGHWLAQLPVKQIRLDAMDANLRMPEEKVYLIHLSGELHDAQLQINGTIQVPSAPKPLVFSVTAVHTGETQLSVTTEENRLVPILEWRVQSVKSDEDQTTVKGTATARMERLIPIFMSKQNSSWGPMLAGELSSEWTARLTSKPQTVSINSTLYLAEQAIALQLQGQYLFTSNHVTADFQLLPVVFSQSGLLLSHLAKDWPYPFDVNAGQISAQGHLDWQKRLNIQGVIQMEKLAGHYNDMTFSGLHAQLPLKLDQGLRTSKEAQIHIDLIDVGLPIEKTDIKFALVPSDKAALPLVQVREFTAQLLGGKASSDAFELDFGRDENALVVKLEHIGLNEIMQLEQQEGLQGSGVLDGEIPIAFTGKNIGVAQGRLSAREPGGVIRYTPTAKIAELAKSNTSIGLMVKALSNFRYQVLDVNSDYKPNGDLKLQVRLEGNNPDWQSGRPVNLNLNLHENIPALLRSLQVSGEISEQVRKRYQNTP